MIASIKEARQASFEIPTVFSLNLSVKYRRHTTKILICKEKCIKIAAQGVAIAFLRLARIAPPPTLHCKHTTKFLIRE